MKIDIKNTSTEIENIEEELVLLDKYLLKKNNQISHKKISEKIFKIRKKILEIEINLNEMELKNVNIKIVNDLKKKINNIQKNLNIISDYNIKILQSKQQKTIDTLTLINTIFLPLSLITGFFGMNFKSMGVPSLNTGIYTISNATFSIICSFILISLVTTLLFKYNRIPEQMIII